MQDEDEDAVEVMRVVKGDPAFSALLRFTTARWQVGVEFTSAWTRLWPLEGCSRLRDLDGSK